MQSYGRFYPVGDSGSEVLEMQKSCSRKVIIGILIIVCIIIFVTGFLIGYFTHSSADKHDSFDSTTFILNTLDKERIRETLKLYSQQPRLPGSALDYQLAEMISNDWRKNNLDEVHYADYNVLISFPNTSSPNMIQVIDPASGSVRFQSIILEKPLTPGENNSNVTPPFNSYSPSGDVTGDIIYVNYGRIEDFLYLQNHSINVSGHIVIARYGQIYRGAKVSNAEQFNATAIILYSDPSDAYMDNTTGPYPDSWWLPPSGVQSGSIGRDSGDSQTPLYPSTDYAYRVPLSELNLPKIPCQPIGYGDAQEILRNMTGDVAPPDWQGKLPFTYHIGSALNASLKVRVVVYNYLTVKPVRNVIGYIRGSEEPDRYVLLGNHHDAWVFGAVDPISGSAALTEITRVFGSMLQSGHRPRRTIVFCSWDGEEPSLLGSVEFVEDHLKVLEERAVAYFNLDYAVDGNYSVAASTSPLLQDALYAAAKKVPSPEPGVGITLYDLWLQRPISLKAPVNEPYVSYSIGSSSDMASFYQRAGVPSLDTWISLNMLSLPIYSYPLYHSRYDSFFAYDTYTDPGFHYTKAIAQFLALLAFDFADADLLPINVERYSAAVENFKTSLVQQFGEIWQQHNVSIQALLSACSNFTASTKAFMNNIRIDPTLLEKPLMLRNVNDRLMKLERAFLDPEGVVGRRDQKHVMFAPSKYDSYKDNSFPGITDTMSEISQGKGSWEVLKQQIFVATYFVQSAAETLMDIGL